jgi:hypothetical protein
MAPRVRWLLHPGLWFILVWALVLGLWAGLTDDAFLRITGSERQFSITSALYLTFALAAFVIGTLLGPDLLFLRGRPIRTPDIAPQATAGALAIATLIALTLGGGTIALIIGLGMAKAGGPAALLEQIRAGVAWSNLAEEYFISSRIQGLTIWVQLNAGVGVLATLGRLVDGGRTPLSRWFLVALTLGFLLSVLQAFVLSDRLATYEYIVAGAAAFIGYRLYTKQPLMSRAVLSRVAIVIALMTLLWAAGEYGRTYLARYGPALTDANGNPIERTDDPSASDVAGDRLIAYLVTSPNNAMYAVDHFENFSVFYRTFKGAFTTLQLDSHKSPIVGPAIIEPARLLDEFYSTPEYTVFSFPGYAYMDLSWGGILICLWFGLVVGAIHYRFASGELWALLIYPFLFVGVLDSWRIFYWSESRMLTCVAFLALTSYLIYHHSRDSRPIAGPAAAESVAGS